MLARVSLPEHDARFMAESHPMFVVEQLMAVIKFQWEAFEGAGSSSSLGPWGSRACGLPSERGQTKTALLTR